MHFTEDVWRGDHFSVTQLGKFVEHGYAVIHGGGAVVYARDEVRVHVYA
jgi:hypothetical protein